MIIRVMEGGIVKTMDLSEYLTGVVRAEMPASFEPEALKAQAVAARTYTLYHLSVGGNHGETADICTNAACCQAYTDKGTAWKKWGEAAQCYEEKIWQAVKETDGQVLLYQGEPILAVFHAASAGMTRPAGAVWSRDVPYLQSVSSPEPETSIPNYYSKKTFTTKAFQQLISAAYAAAHFSEDVDRWISDPITDAAGNVEQITVGGITIKGTELRSILELRSACFTWEVTGKDITFYVTGYGHGVGLSQYGANQMAKDGAGWKEILSHYYTGVSVGGYCFTNGLQT
jgi:stage II sporulation protein D